MKVRGWVFVVTNPLAPELCRIAFSAKDPKWRAKEMNKGGVGQPFVVEYAVLIDNPHWYKLMACRKLTAEGKQEVKDWFRCPSEDAAAVVREAVGENRIFSELIRGIENVKRAEPLPDTAGTPAPLSPEILTAGVPEKRGDGDVPAPPPGHEIDSLELAAAIRKALENAEKNAPANHEILHQESEEAPIRIEDVLSAIVPEDATKEEMEKLREEKRQREKREEVRHDVDEVRRVMEERKRTEQEPQEPQVKELDLIVATSIDVEEEKKRSRILEISLVFLSDVGCIYIIIVAKSTMIIAVAVLLAAIFSLLLMDAFRQYRQEAAHKQKPN